MSGISICCTQPFVLLTLDASREEQAPAASVQRKREEKTWYEQRVKVTAVSLSTAANNPVSGALGRDSSHRSTADARQCPRAEVCEGRHTCMKRSGPKVCQHNLRDSPSFPPILISSQSCLRHPGKGAPWSCRSAKGAARKCQPVFVRRSVSQQTYHRIILGTASALWADTA